MVAQLRSIRADLPGRLMTNWVLQAETEAFRGSGAISADNSSLGFRPAFLDTRTEAIYVSRYADGRPAPFHLLDGLPDELVVERSASGRVSAVKACIISGFVCDGRFYTRDKAARRAAELTWR